jgi:hypothetical protein
MRQTDIFGWGLLTVLLAFVLSYNYHQLWLVYDLALLILFSKLILEGVFSQVKYIRLILILLLVVIVVHVVGLGHNQLISWLSFWDTFKHLIFIVGVDYFITHRSSEIKQKWIGQLMGLSFILFVVQFCFVTFQHYQGRHVDDVAGTFGDGSSHSIAYFSIFLMVYAFAKRWQLWKIILLSLVCSLMNYWSENIGFFLILLLVIYYYTSIYRAVRWVMIAAGALTVLFFLFGSQLGDEFDEYQRRIQGFFSVKTFVLSDDLSSDRSTLTAYAFFEGGVWGRGAGYFSEIYSKEGEGVKRLYNNQINISEVSHLIAEFGVVGAIITFVIYLLLLIDIGKIAQRAEWFIACFLLLTFLYNRILMDERIIFFTVLSVILIRIDQQRFFGFGSTKV